MKQVRTRLFCRHHIYSGIVLLVFAFLAWVAFLHGVET